jgi:WD40 repeat protein
MLLVFTPLLLATLIAVPLPRELAVAGVHRDLIVDLRFTPDGRGLVSVDREGHVVRWNLATGKPVGRVRLGPFPEHASPEFVISPTGRHIAVGASNGPPRVYDAATGAVVATLPRPLPDADSWLPAFSADGARVVFGYARGHGSPNSGPVSVPVWDIARDRAVGTVELPMPPGGIVNTCLALSPDGARLAVAITPAPRTGGDTGVELGVWETATGRRVATGGRQDDSVTDISFLPNGRSLLIHGPSPIAVWEPDVDRWRPVLTRWRRFWNPTLAPDGRTFVAPVTLPPGLTNLRSSIDSNSLTWYAVIETATLADRGPLIPGSDSTPANSLNTTAVGPAGRLFAAFDGNRIRLFNLIDDTLDLATWKERLGPEELWASLAGTPEEAGRAIRLLTARPPVTVALFREKLSPAALAEPDAATVAKLIAQLDAPAFADREAAAKQLAAAIRFVEPQLSAAHAAATSPEQRERLAALLAGAEKFTREELRHVRAVEVLEKIGTPAAAALVERLAGGNPDALLTREARATLSRLVR